VCKPFCKEVKRSGSRQYQLISREVTKSDAAGKATKPQQFRNTDEFKITV